MNAKIKVYVCLIVVNSVLYDTRSRLNMSNKEVPKYIYIIGRYKFELQF